MLADMTKLVTVGVAALVLAGAGAASTGPSLRVVSTRPFVVQGSHFKPTERVVVTLTANRQRTVRRVTVTRSGTFGTSFGSVRLDRCSGYVVRAAGLGGSVALAKKLPLPACLPAKTP